LVNESESPFLAASIPQWQLPGCVQKVPSLAPTPQTLANMTSPILAQFQIAQKNMALKFHD
jgi:hypothetical protein